jgi:hypothetical protein
VSADAGKAMGELIPPKLQKSKSWAGEYGHLTLEEVTEKAASGDVKAKKLLKLYKERERLMKKVK